MALPFSASSANQIVYPTGIASALAQVWLWDPGYALQEDPAIYEKMLRDPVVAGALDHLERLIVGHDWSYQPREDEKEDRELSRVLEGLTRKQRGFPQAIKNLSRASFMGASWGLIFPERRKLRLGDGKEREWTVIAKVRDVDKRRFRLTQAYTLGQQTPSKVPDVGQLRNTDRSVELEKEVSAAQAAGRFPPTALGSFRWEFHRGWDYRNHSSLWWAPLSATAPDERWIQHVPDNSERGLGYGFGWADDVYFYWLGKQNVMKYGLQGLERWGQGFLYARVKALREGGYAKGANQASVMQNTLASMRTWRAENYAVVDENTELALLDMPATAEAACREWIEYFDREITKRLLAALQPTGGGKGSGSFSSSKIEEGSTDSMVAYLRTVLCETWDHTATAFLVEHNQDNLAELGLLGVEAGGLQLRGKETRAIDDVVKVFTLARDLQRPVRNEDFYSWTGLTAPNDEDEAVVFDLPAAPLGVGAMDQVEAERGPVGSGGESVAEVGHKNGVAA
jgi:hypothetical protein